jgi:tetratricopeptide (TPR) repeat protein
MANYEFWDELSKIVSAANAYQDKSIEFNRRFINPWLDLSGVFGVEDKAKDFAATLMKKVAHDSENVDAWFELGLAQLLADEFDRAQQSFLRLLELDPEHGMAYFHLGQLNLKAGRLQSAEYSCLHALDYLSNDEDIKNAWNLLGDIFRQQNQYEKAFTAYQQAGALSSSTSITQPQESFAHKPEESTSKTVEFPEESVPQFFNTLLDDRVYFDEDDDALIVWEEEAWDDLLAAEHKEGTERSINPQEVPARLGASTEESTEGSIDGANDLEDEVDPLIIASNFEDSLVFPVAEPPQEPVQGKSLPVWLDTESEHVPATSVGTTTEEFSTHYVAEADIPVYDEKWRDAPFSQAVNLSDPENMTQSTPLDGGVETLDNVSRTLNERMGDKDANVWNELGVVYFNNGAFENAITAFSRAIEIDPTLAWPYSNLALVLVQQKKFEEAISLYQRSIELFEDDIDKATSWNRLGNVYRLINDHDNAITSYQRADELDPVNITLAMQSRYSLLGNSIPVMDQIP